MSTGNILGKQLWIYLFTDFYIVLLFLLYVIFENFLLCKLYTIIHFLGQFTFLNLNLSYIFKKDENFYKKLSLKTHKAAPL